MIESKLHWQQELSLDSSIDNVGLKVDYESGAKADVLNFFKNTLGVDVPDKKIINYFVKKISLRIFIISYKEQSAPLSSLNMMSRNA